MRWILEWLFEDLLRLFDPFASEQRFLREGMMRAHRRRARHRAAAREASERAGELLRRVRAMEISEGADVGELVAARRGLVQAEGDMRHHRARVNQAEEALRLMKTDRDRMRDGKPPAHRKVYQELLNR